MDVATSVKNVMRTLAMITLGVIMGLFGTAIGHVLSGHDFIPNWYIALSVGFFMGGRFSQIMTKIAIREISPSFDQFVTTRLIAIRDRRPMWGCPEAVELQALTLIEVENYLQRPEVDLREAIDTYQEEIKVQFPKSPTMPLCQLDLSDDEFNENLFTVIQRTRARLKG